jgi:predicted DCC family thiol-disulfide oxidoreductase YuxK
MASGAGSVEARSSEDGPGVAGSRAGGSSRAGSSAGANRDAGSATPGSGWTVEVFYDGDCPLCMREIRMLMRLDRARRIRFTNIAAPEFDAGAYGLTQADFMARIRGRAPDGAWIEGVEVFRRLYTAVGFGPIAKLTRLPGVSHALDAAYVVFAKNRLRITGRGDAAASSCADGACRVPERVASPAEG